MSVPSGADDWPALLVEGRLEKVPGGPYDAEAVDIAVSTVRGECGWHIAPIITEQLVLDGDGSTALLLPSLRIRDVVEVRLADGPLLTSGFEWSEAGMLTRRAGWPARRRAVTAVIEHGYRECPAELVGLIAEVAAAFRAAPAGVKSSTRDVGGVRTTRTFLDSGPVQHALRTFEHVLTRYRVTVPV